MKTLFAVFLIAVVGLSCHSVVAQAADGHSHEGHDHQNHAQTSASGSADLLPTQKIGDSQRVHVKVKGLVCDYCARAMEKVFKKRPEVAHIFISLTTKVITLDLHKDRSLDDETIKKLVLDSGYNVEKIERT